MDSFYKNYELNEMGFKKLGENVLISKKASLYSADKISIGDNVRIDDFCILSGEISIGKYVHIAAYSAIYGGAEGVVLSDFSNISSRVTIYAQSDDFSGESMTNPMIPEKFKRIMNRKVYIGKHVIIGSGSVILPGVILNEGSSFGALSLINKDADEWSIYCGIPCKKIKDRKKNILLLEKEFLREITESNQ